MMGRSIEKWREALKAAEGIHPGERKQDERLGPEGNHEYAIGRSRARGGI